MTISSFDRDVAKALRRAKVDFERDAGVGGAGADFVVTSPGGVMALHSKDWKPTRANLARAAAQVARYKESTGADEAFVVLKDLKKSDPEKGLLAVGDLDKVMAEMRERQAQRPPRREKDRPTVQERMIFAAMPFDPAYDDVYFVAMREAAQKVDAYCRRLDQEDFTGDIIAEIKASIRKAAAVIADLSEAKPNVLYETGYAHALGKPTIHISRTPLSKLPFDVSTWKTLVYNAGQTYQLGKKLTQQLRAVLRS